MESSSNITPYTYVVLVVLFIFIWAIFSVCDDYEIYSSAANISLCILIVPIVFLWIIFFAIAKC